MDDSYIDLMQDAGDLLSFMLVTPEIAGSLNIANRKMLVSTSLGCSAALLLAFGIPTLNGVGMKPGDIPVLIFTFCAMPLIIGLSCRGFQRSPSGPGTDRFSKTLLVIGVTIFVVTRFVGIINAADRAGL